MVVQKWLRLVEEYEGVTSRGGYGKVLVNIFKYHNVLLY